VTRIDHVLFAVRDFAETTARLSAEFGLEAVEGGRHTGWGTANWIVPLGASYLELIGVLDPASATGNPFGRRVQQVIAEGGGPFAWCVTPADFDATVVRLELESGSGSRRRPDGVTVSWRMAGLDVALADPSRPFFLDWQVAPQDHPGRAVGGHRVQPEGIAWVEVRGDEAAIRTWLGDDELPIRVRPGPPAVLAVGIATQEGEIVLP
jgi:catechol 2,3-dioxygenase-like lactoylglutathione lyase family enzyme